MIYNCNFPLTVILLRDVPLNSCLLNKFKGEVFFVGVETGTLYLIKHKLPILFACGDFDTTTFEERLFIKSQVNNIYHVDKKKNFYDSEMAIQIILKKLPTTQILIITQNHDRCDMLLVHISLLKFFWPSTIVIQDLKNIFFLIDKTTIFKKSDWLAYRYVSLWNVSDELIVKLEGFEYSIDWHHHYIFNSFIASNELKNNQNIIHIKKGLCLVIFSND